MFTATYTEISTYTVSFSVNGTIDATLTQTGSSIVLQTLSNLIPAGFEIIGWSESSNSTDAVANPYTPTASCTLYAIMQMKNVPTVAYYEKVTENLTDWSGDYLIVYENGNLAFDGSRETLDDTNNTIDVTITNGKIEASNETDAAAFTIAPMENGYSIRNAGNTYIGQNSNSNGMATSETAIQNTLDCNDGDVDIVSSSAHLRYNSASNQARFRYYKSSSYTNQKAIQLYKRTTSGPTAYNMVVNVNTPTTITDDIAETELVVVAPFLIFLCLVKPIEVIIRSGGNHAGGNGINVVDGR